MKMSMSYPISFAALAFIGGTVLFAQTAPAPATPAAPPARVPTPAEAARAAAAEPAEAIVLSPFEVREDEYQGYLATTVQSGTRLRSDLKDIAAPISVVTKDFMQDIGARNLEDLLTYTLGTEVGGVGGNFSESSNSALASGAEMNYDGAFANVSPGTRVRGLTSADGTRDFFSTGVPLDSYNVERIEITRGANAMLFGLGSPSGIINSSLIKADLLRRKTEVSYRTDQYGSYRASLDHNHVLMRDKFALRLATVYDKAYYKVEPAYNQTQRGFLTATYKPFKDTIIRANGEWGEVNSNRPRINPPVDNYTLWWKIGRPTYNLTNGTITLLGTPTLVSPLTATGGRNSNVIVTAVGTSGGTNNMTLVYSDPNSSQLGIPGTNAVGWRSGQIANVRRNAAGALAADGPMGVADMTRILNQVIYVGQPTQNFYKNPQLTDPAIYDFYNQMLDGPNKFEWADWKTFNVTLEQFFFRRKAGIELAYDKQKLDQGNVLPLSSASAYTIRVDINTHLPNGMPNPNLGRPMTTGFQQANLSGADSDTARATGFYDLDLTKVGPTWLGKVLGSHRFTATHTRLQNFNERYGASFAFNSGVAYQYDNQGVINDASTQGRDVSIIHYVGPNVSGSATPATGLVTPTGQMPNGIVNVPIMWAGTDTTPPGGTAQWVIREYGLLGNGKKDLNNTRRASGIRRTQTKINSTSLIAQSHWFERSLVSTVGWRRDDVHSYDSGTAPRDPVTGIGINDPAVIPLRKVGSLSEDTISWGVVGHAPKFITKHLPWGTEFGVSVNRSDNFRPAGQRYNLFDQAIDPEVGETKDYGIYLSTFNGKLVLRATRYTTTSANANVTLPVQNLADNMERVLDQIAKGANDANPAGIAAFNQFLTTTEGKALLNTFRLVQNGTNWDYDRRTGQVFNTSDVVSEGDEYEVILNPTRNWRVAFNAAKAVAIRSNTGTDMLRIVNTMIPLIAGPAGQLRQEDSGALFGNVMRQGVVVPMLQVTTQDGSPTNELRRWRWNMVTNYRFTEGRVRGFSVGAAARWQDKVAIGFPVIVDPVAGPIPDVKNPYYGPTEINYDAWIGYGRKFRNNKIAWNVQLNVKNLGVGDELIPVNTQPDGSINSWRIAEPMKWTLSNTFTF